MRDAHGVLDPEFVIVNKKKRVSWGKTSRHSHISDYRWEFGCRKEGRRGKKAYSRTGLTEARAMHGADLRRGVRAGWARSRRVEECDMRWWGGC